MSPKFKKQRPGSPKRDSWELHNGLLVLQTPAGEGSEVILDWPILLKYSPLRFMTSNAIRSAHRLSTREHTESHLSKWIARAVMASVMCSVVSIAGSGIFLGAAISLWICQVLATGRLQLRTPPFGKLLLLFMAMVMVSIIFSADPAFSLRHVKKFIRFAPVIFIFSYCTRDQVEWTLKATLLLISLSALLGIVQFYWLFEVDLLNRIRGFMSHWMTFSGQLMMGIIALSGLILAPFFNGDRATRDSREKDLTRPSRWFWAWMLVLMSGALLLTLTRSAWLGALFGLFCWLLILRRRWVIPLTMVLIAFFLLLPGSFHRRVLDGFNLNDTTTRTRIELLVTGGRMVADHPLTGVGPRMVPRLADEYRSHREFPDWLYQHLHNTPLQIGAEMGAITLMVWFSIWLFLLRDYWRMARKRDNSGSPDLMSRYLCYTGMCIVVAFLGAGLLEYNFGDSELVTLLMFFVTAPYVHSDGLQAAA